MHTLINMILTRGIAFNDMADEIDPTLLPPSSREERKSSRSLFIWDFFLIA